MPTYDISFSETADATGVITKTETVDIPLDIKVRSITLQTSSGCESREHNLSFEIDGKKLFDATFKDCEEFKRTRTQVVKGGKRNLKLIADKFRPNEIVSGICKVTGGINLFGDLLPALHSETAGVVGGNAVVENVERDVRAALAALTNTAPGDNDDKVHVRLTVLYGKVGIHVSRYDGRGPIPPMSRYTKLVSCDDSNDCRVTKSNEFNHIVKVGGGGTIIVDLADWEDGPGVVLEINVNDERRFWGTGDKSNIDGWSDRYYGPGARKTDDREIAIDIDPPI